MKKKTAPLLYVGITAEAVRAVLSGVKEIVNLKIDDSLKLAAIHALGDAARAQPVNISNCYFTGEGK